jgi:hypothetical protein
VSARYWVLVADELMDSGPPWPDGLRAVERGLALTAGPGTHWWLFEDDGAPASLEGRQVELTFVRSGDGVMIGSRSPHV